MTEGDQLIIGWIHGNDFEIYQGYYGCVNVTTVEVQLVGNAGNGKISNTATRFLTRLRLTKQTNVISMYGVTTFPSGITSQDIDNATTFLDWNGVVVIIHDESS